jgi:putative sigma-54 modulation protein
MALKVELNTQNFENTDRINDYVNKKVSKLDKFLKGIDTVQIDLAYVKSARNASDRQVAQITLRGKGFILRSEERAADIFTAIDTSVDKIQRQIERFKGKRERGRGVEVETLEPVEVETLVEDEIQPEIVRRKEFFISDNPMDEIEAIEQMTLLGHENFFIFFNGNSNEINVLYKRRDGTYGLIIPKIK